MNAFDSGVADIPCDQASQKMAQKMGQKMGSDTVNAMSIPGHRRFPLVEILSG